jgi:glutamate/tyrosine decarboxylase-like PLP-dependent enzyme
MTQKMILQEEMFAQLAGKALFEQAAAYAYDYLDRLSERPAFPPEETVKALEIFAEPLPEMPADPQQILRLLHEYGSPATAMQTGGRYFGFVNGGAVPVALAAKWLSAVWDQNAALAITSPIAAQLEAVCESWLVNLFGLPADTAAGFVGGSAVATLCGLAAGRNELLRRQGWDVNTDGLFGAPHLRVIVGQQAHATVFKALSLLGLGRNRVEVVPADSQGRLIADSLPALDAHCLVVIQAGNVNSGAFDPIAEICSRARQANAWVHIDGAFGLWAAASPNKKFLTQGLEKADSWSVDGHKTLNAPYDSGIILCRHRDALVAAMQTTASYILTGDKRDGMQYTPDMSRRARSVELWATLKYLGQQGVAQLVDGLCTHAEQLATRLHSHGFRILNEVVFNQVLLACDTPAQTKAVLQRIQQSGECWCGGTVWQGEAAIRLSVCSWATTEEDMARTVAAFVKARDGSRVD